MDALVLSTGLAALLANVGLGGGIFEHGLVDRAWPKRPDIVQQRRGGIDRKRFWIPAHSVFEIVLLVALYPARGNPDVRNALLVAFAAVAPDPDEFPKLLDQMGALMRQPYDWSADVAKLTMPVMLVYGDSDMIRPEHIVEFYQLLGGGLKDAGWQRENMSQNRLAILPGVTHYELSQTPQLVPAILPFLDGQAGP